MHKLQSDIQAEHVRILRAHEYSVLSLHIRQRYHKTSMLIHLKNTATHEQRHHMTSYSHQCSLT